MSEFNYFSAFINSILKPKEYIFFYKSTKRQAIKYIFILSLVMGMIGYSRPAYNYYNFITIISKEVQKQFPQFEFRKGELYVYGQQPYSFNKGDLSVVIDTTGSINEDKLNDYSKIILILKDRAFYKSNNFNIDEVKYYILDDLSFNKEILVKYINLFKIGTAVIIGLFPILIFFANIFLSVVVSLLGTIVNSVLKADIKYGDLFKLSLYSMTTPILTASILRFIGVKELMLNYVYIAVAFVYLFLAIKNIILNEVETEKRLP